MKQLIMLFAVVLFSISARAQNKITLQISDSETKSPLPGATVRITHLKDIAFNKSGVADQNGSVTITDLPQGSYLMIFSYIGYVSKKETIHIPLDATRPEPYTIFLDPEEELEEIVIAATRSSRTIANIPTRVELIAGEELDEKANMKPGDIRLLLSESTGIQTQQTSATSANASIRIQGLDGRYTQILKDGFPIYSGAASGLGLLQTPPLDLKRVEVIKGSASTLYGGGAIAGLVNLVSKSPSEEQELSFHLNGTSAQGLDLSGFFGQRFGKAGLTVFAARNTSVAYAPDDLEFTAIPEYERYTLNPRLYLYLTDKTQLNFGINANIETRTGGDIHYIKGENDPAHSFFERNKTNRWSTQFTLNHQLDTSSAFTLKNSVSYFNRKLNIPDYAFEGSQYSSYTEASYSLQKTKFEWIGGINILTDQFKEDIQTDVPLRDYSQTTFGAFIQNTTSAADWLDIELGLRGDYVKDYGFAFLPRLSTLFKINEHWHSRIGGGFGYKTPTIFTEESERIQYKNVQPISVNNNKLEKSYGLNADVNYRTSLFNEQVSLSINHLVFYTYLKNPLIMLSVMPDQYRFENIEGHVDSRGMETNVKLSYLDFKLFLGYSLTDTKIHQNGALTRNPLTAIHRLNNVLMYEVEEKWKLGAEAYYFSKQKLNDGTYGKPFWTFGFMAEKLWERFSVYINFENFTDTRQTRFGSIYSGTLANPVFTDIYAPLDGFVVNGGLKLRLGN